MKKRYWIPLLIIVILIAVRIALPYIIIDVINNQLEDLDGYTGSVQDVDLHLYQGAYAIDSLEIDKIEANNEIAFLTIDHIFLSVEWSALFDGAIVGSVQLNKPVVNFIAPYHDEGETGEEINWPEQAQKLMPIRINKFEIVDGLVRYRDFNADPEVNMPVHDIRMEIYNITNVADSTKELPTTIEFSATTMGDGQLNLSADANFLEEIPDLDATLELEEVYLPDLNKFLEAYAGVDAESGFFNLYSEIVVKDGMLEGYVRPILDGIKIVDFEDPEGNVLEMAWEGIVGFVTEVFENQREDQFASEVPLEGDLNNIDTGVYPAIWNIFRNAFVEAFSKEAGGQIDFQEVEN